MIGRNDEYMRVEVVDTFRIRKLDMLGLYETRLRGSETFKWSGVKMYDQIHKMMQMLVQEKDVNEGMD